MKNLLLLSFLFFFSIHISSQSFLSLDGIENLNSETILLFHYGDLNFRNYSPVYKFDVTSGYEKKLMDAYYLNESDTRTVQDFEYFPNDTLDFINCGYGVMPDNYGYVAFIDSSVFGFQQQFLYVNISKQDTLKTYAGGDGQLYRSFDGGLTYPQDSTLNFHMISVSDFNDNEMFGIDSQNNLIKSFDGGHTSIIVDNNPVYEENNFNPEFYYDPDQSHIYRINKSGSYNLYVSNDNGNSYTWELKAEYEHPFVFANDKSVSGTCYLGYYYSLYKSANYGNSFSLLYHFDERITGVYPKPSSQILYIATQYHIYKLENNSLTTLKEIPPDPALAGYYPLHVGDVWIFDGYTWSYPEYNDYQYIRKINSEVTKPNQKDYFEVEEYTAGSPYHNIFYERVDTEEVKVYRYNEDSVQTNQEYLIDDLNAGLGDTVMSYRFETYLPFVVTYAADTSIYGLTKSTKFYESNSLISYRYQLVKDFGITDIESGFDFGYDSKILRGAVINGTLYGDTTLTGVEDNPVRINSFSLSQNYPNPFNPTTTIKYTIPNVISTKGRNLFVTLKVYDVLGNEVATLVNEEKPAGSYAAKFNGSRLASGIYFYQIKAGDYTTTKKLILLK